MLRNPLLRAAGLIVGYVATLWAARLVVLTLTTFVMLRADEPAPQHGVLQKIGDSVRANQIVTYGVAAFLFVLALHLMQPLARTRLKSVFGFDGIREWLVPNALNGLILAAVLIAGSTLGGHMSYLGVYLRFDEVAMIVVTALVFGVSLLSMVLVEEYALRAVFEPAVAHAAGRAAALALSTAAYLAIRHFQFGLGWVEALNFLLLNLTLSLVASHAHRADAQRQTSFAASAVFCTSFLLVAHVVFGLPFMGQSLPGIFLLRGSSESALGQLISGGAQGPESGLVLAVLLVIYLYFPQIRSRKIEA